MRRKLFGTLFTLLGATVILLGLQTPAQAAPSPHVVPQATSGTGCDAADCWVLQATGTGNCYAEIDFGDENYAWAYFSNSDAGWACTGWMERSTDSGSTWGVVSGYHTVATGGTTTSDNTGQYWDGGANYRARACFHLNFSGAAHHCSPAIYWL